MIGDDPCIPGLVHRCKICAAGKENRRIKNTRLAAALFLQHRVNLRQGIGGLRAGVGIQVGRHAGVVQRLVVNHHIRPAGFGINTRNGHVYFLFVPVH